MRQRDLHGSLSSTQAGVHAYGPWTVAAAATGRRPPVCSRTAACRRHLRVSVTYTHNTCHVCGWMFAAKLRG